MSHWFGALAHASPWNYAMDSTDTTVGFTFSSYGLIALIIGTILGDLVMSSRPPVPSLPSASLDHRAQFATMHFIGFRILLPIGVASWLATFTPVAELPSAAAILSAGKQCLLLAICLLAWAEWQIGKLSRFVFWLGLTSLLPVVTVVSAGFIGYGIVMVTTVLAFTAMYFRPRWPLLLGLLAMLYGGVSLWVTYAEHRGEIRTSVWGGDQTSIVLEKVFKVVQEFELFDISNQDHLKNVDLRLNQNHLVGAAVRNTPSMVPFRNGETIYAAMLSIIPRAIWPDKPEVGGSGNYVSEHTLTSFAAGTSVGMGQVLEFYINFGTPCLIIGFVLLGAALRALDIRLAEALKAGQIQTVVLVFLTGSGLLQAGGSLNEVAASAASGVVFSIGISRLLSHIERRKNRQLSSLRAPIR
ncbi:MAG: hypothetical protein F9K44_03660 [Hyphomicrobiaceae bacterium]|nr:MAG: hypothetical protein F9K44_03660 [Hyphomicrobiaceae bacterium]